MSSNLTKSKGNMYDWVTHTHSHIGGKCSHGCEYCYVQAMAKKFPAMKEKYSGDIKLIEGSLDVDYGKGRTIFIDHMNDLFAEGVPDAMISKVLSHCRNSPDNKYVFQTKNPQRYGSWIGKGLFPSEIILGTTIESNRHHSCMQNAPTTFSRIIGMENVYDYETFITLEPILDFDVNDLFDMLTYAEPSFINIGADSKGQGLDEPTFEKIMELYELLVGAGIEVRKKLNLERLQVKFPEYDKQKKDCIEGGWLMKGNICGAFDDDGRGIDCSASTCPYVNKS